MNTTPVKAQLRACLSVAVIVNVLAAGSGIDCASASAKETSGSSKAKSRTSSSSKEAFVSRAKTKSSTAAPPLSKEELARKNYTQTVDGFYDGLFKLVPQWATEVGIHEYDGLMPDVSADGVHKQIRFYKDTLRKLDALDLTVLNEEEKLDRLLLVSQIKGSLLELEEVRKWRRDPDEYSSLSCSVIFSLMKRDFAPLPDRLKSVIAREQAIPAMLKVARKNLIAAEVPPIYSEIALEQMPGIVSFFENDVPAAFASVKEAELKSQFEAANKEVVAALKDYAKFLEKEIAPNCRGTYAIGADAYRKKLLYDELIDEPIDKILARGYTELRRLQKDFARTAHAIDPNRSALKVFEGISADHPKPDELIDSVKKCLEDLRTFCLEKSIVSVPSEERATVAETPPFLRALSFASMDTPGPFERKAKEAYYHVTLPEKSWPARRIEEHLRTFSYPDILNTSVHEAYPGHYVQFLWVNANTSKVRKLYSCGSNAEGWAHYCEQMMVDEGLKQGDLKLRLVQLHDALLRCCRYIVGIRMHTDKMTVAEGTDFFVKEGYQERANGEREAKRGTSDPTYLVYTLGKLQILGLREDYKKKVGDQFALKDFHDKFLSLGCPPIKVARIKLLGDSSESIKLSARPDKRSRHM